MTTLQNPNPTQAITTGNGRNTILAIKNLRVHYATTTGDVIAVNGVNLDIYERETVGLVGESGCGKTTLAMGILRLVQPPGRIVHGQAIINKIDIMALKDEELRQVRWRELALIPQGAMNSLNPVLKVKTQIGEAITTHVGMYNKQELKERILDLLNLVGLPARVYEMYPHELSGGMKQRVCIAMAIALQPAVIIADEPTSALDVVVQRVVAQTLLDVKARLAVSMILIGHDMGLMAQLVDRIVVMYAGNIVEVGPVAEVYDRTYHPYTQLLIAAIPSIKEKKPLHVTEGLTHDLRRPPPGCVFQLRCPHVMDICRQEVPPAKVMGADHHVACHLY
jgi:oligopeptide/dipeptide ABC transporter ATP-binding protein